MLNLVVHTVSSRF